MKAGILQLTSTDDPSANLTATRAMMRDAVGQGVGFILTPEVTNCVSVSRRHQQSVLCLEADDPTLAGLRAEAAALEVWLSIGSLALQTDDPDGRFANRSFVINPAGDIVARYDKIHMFDVEVADSQRHYRESLTFEPGDELVVVPTPLGKIGLSVCYDIRFPELYRGLFAQGAECLLMPSAFTRVTGEAHFEVLMRARAIENVAYTIAACQGGVHDSGRETFGHSMVISPWGEVVAKLGLGEAILLADIDLDAVHRIRRDMPVHQQRRL